MKKYGRQAWSAETDGKTWYGVLWLGVEQAVCYEHCNESLDSWLYSLELSVEFRDKKVYDLLSYS